MAGQLLAALRHEQEAPLAAVEAGRDLIDHPARQIVGEGPKAGLVLAHRRLGDAPLGDVDGDREDAVGLARRAADDRDRVVHPDDRAVGTDVALLVGVGRSVGDGPLELDEVGREIVGMGDLLQRRGQQLLAGAAGDLAEAVVDEGEAAGEVDLGEAGRGLVDEGGELALALPAAPPPPPCGR